MKRDTFVKILILLALLLVVVLGFIFAPRILQLARDLMLPSEANGSIIQEIDEDIEVEPIEEDEEEEPYYPEDEEEEEELAEEERVPLPLVPEARARYGNEDIVARITIPGTAIDYLIAHTDDNSFYLYHDLWRNRTAAGTVFLDYLNTPDFRDSSSIIYGHNMRNGTKFHDVRFYRGREFFETNNEMIVTTLYEELYYDIFAVFITHINFNYIQVEFEDDEFLELVQEMKSRSYHDTEVEIGEDDSILILSTCWGPVGTDYRLVMAGRLRDDDDTEYYE